MYLAVFAVPGRMAVGRFVFVLLVVNVVVEPMTEPAALSEMPLKGSGVGVWVVDDDDDAGAPLLSVTQADSEAPLLGSREGALEPVTRGGVGVLLLLPADAGWVVVSADMSLINEVEGNITHLSHCYRCSD